MNRMHLRHVSWRAWPLVVGLVGLLLCALRLPAQPQDTLASYLFAWLYFLGLSLGSLGVLLIHNLTGGSWSRPVHRYFMAALAPLLLLTLLFVPVALGLSHLFPWTAQATPDVALPHFKSLYLNIPSFLVRSAAALLAWNLLAALVRARQDGGANAIALIVYTISMTWAAVDWIASLQPQWSSSALGLVIITGQGLGAFALATFCATTNRKPTPPLQPLECRDLGNLLLTFVMTWMYLGFVQFLIIWGEDLPRETIWVRPRLQTSWVALTLVVVGGQFALPFVLLLFRTVKQRAPRLGGIALAVLVSNWLYAAWLILPSVRIAGLRFAWTDLTATLAVGGLWLHVFLRRLQTPGLILHSEAVPSSDGRPVHGS